MIVEICLIHKKEHYKGKEVIISIVGIVIINSILKQIVLTERKIIL